MEYKKSRKIKLLFFSDVDYILLPMIMVTWIIKKKEIFILIYFSFIKILLQ